MEDDATGVIAVKNTNENTGEKYCKKTSGTDYSTIQFVFFQPFLQNLSLKYVN